MKANVEIPKGAIMQRGGKVLGVKPRTPLGMMGADELERMAAVIRRFEIPYVKLTSGQRFLLSGLPPEDMEAARGMLGDMAGFTPHYVQACPGTDVCEFGLRDSMEVGRRLEELLVSLDLPAKVKAGVSGCPRCCGESMVRDLGLVGRRSGWTLVFGGNAGIAPRVGDVLADKLSDEEALDLAARVLHIYIDKAPKKIRTARFVERMGLDALKRECGL
ncbi:nitrite and sulfite reductase 4Fe-4S region [Desulfovibrio sp. X2]|uniref:nitrite and sulfite reductase 4Fe-4S region n=1 Tax=Desulfovibrio sp. X2 TaxID=941449 RepID=UPI0003587CAD|nr:nitrite and sulfite reductase 4Fe-4S region [Desulfovibrio sp. X2]EPR37481.1 nitrite and sulfite reductase 4Fe-4S region [Desulfovibrio sp. X2]